MQDLDAIVHEALALFSRIEQPDQLEQAKARYLGRSGTLTELLKGLGKLPAAERPAMGSRINAAKARLEDALAAQREKIQAQQLNARLAEEKLDVTFDVEPAAEECQLPGFLIHPLVENAVKHGMTNNSEPLKICIAARTRNGRLVVEVANTGRLDTQTPQTNGGGTRIGLRNVRERLAKLYPDNSSFSLRQDGAWIRATIEID